MRTWSRPVSPFVLHNKGGVSTCPGSAPPPRRQAKASGSESLQDADPAGRKAHQEAQEKGAQETLNVRGGRRCPRAEEPNWISGPFSQLCTEGRV